MSCSNNGITREKMCFCHFNDECDIRPVNGTKCYGSYYVTNHNNSKT